MGCSPDAAPSGQITNCADFPGCAARPWALRENPVGAWRARPLVQQSHHLRSQSRKYFADLAQQIVAVRPLKDVDARLIPAAAAIVRSGLARRQVDRPHVGEEIGIEEERKRQAITA